MKRLRKWSLWGVAVVLVSLMAPVAFATAASAETQAEQDCVNAVNAGYGYDYGANYSYSAACIALADGLSNFSYVNIGGAYTGGGTIVGHLQFLIEGSSQGNFDTNDYGTSAVEVHISNPPTCPTYQVIFWENNTNGSYTNLGEATFSVTCTVAGNPGNPVVTQIAKIE